MKDVSHRPASAKAVSKKAAPKRALPKSAAPQRTVKKITVAKESAAEIRKPPKRIAINTQGGKAVGITTPAVVAQRLSTMWSSSAETATAKTHECEGVSAKVVTEREVVQAEVSVNDTVGSAVQPAAPIETADSAIPATDLQENVLKQDLAPPQGWMNH